MVFTEWLQDLKHVMCSCMSTQVRAAAAQEGNSGHTKGMHKRCTRLCQGVQLRIPPSYQFQAYWLWAQLLLLGLI
jgi:hypothetical protein